MSRLLLVFAKTLGIFCSFLYQNHLSSANVSIISSSCHDKFSWTVRDELFFKKTISLFLYFEKESLDVSLQLVEAFCKHCMTTFVSCSEEVHESCFC